MIAQPSAPAAGPQLDNRRVLAALLDLAIIVVGVFALNFVFGMVSGGDGGFGGQMYAIAGAWALYYYFAFESGDGQTPGKKLLKLRVVRADGGATSMREIAVRTALRVVDGLFVYLVGLIVMLVTGQKRQRLGDLAAGTMVVDAGDAPEPTAAAAPAAVAAPAAPAAPEAPEAPEAIEVAEAPEAGAPTPEPTIAKSPVDIGAPLPGMSAPEQPATPELKEFTPFAEPVVDEPQVEAAPEPQVEVAPEPVYEAASEPVYEAASEPVVEPQVEPIAVEPQGEEPQPEVAPDPPYEAPSYEPEPVAEEPQVDIVPEPAHEAPSYEPAPEADVAPEPANEAPVEPAPAEPAEAAADEEPDGEQMTVRPMDTPVSAMDLLMAEDDDDSPQDSEPPEGA